MKDKKLTMYFPVPYSFDWDNISIEQLEQDLAALKALGTTHIEITTDETYYGSCTVKCTATAHRKETDEEQKDRLAKEAAHMDSIKQRELAYLEQLKQKYESRQ